MSASLSSPVLRWLLIGLCVLSCVPLCAVEVAAAESGLEPAFGASLQANIVWEFASNRARMIQVSLVIVALGCAMMWWYK
jgi:hypothetical protein